MFRSTAAIGLFSLALTGALVSRAQSPEIMIASTVSQTLPPKKPTTLHPLQTPVTLYLPASNSPNPNPNPLPVPFLSQAPFGDWREPYQNTCEEMSLLLVHHFLEKSSITPQQGNNELLALLKWEKTHTFGTSITLLQLVTIAQDVFGYHPIITDDVTIEQIEKLINAGHPVIAPTAGRMLLNPYFEEGGPWYHMLVIIGYDDTHFITQDVGTSMGEQYRYEKHLLLNAIHDWTGKKTGISKGTRRIMILS